MRNLAALILGILIPFCVFATAFPTLKLAWEPGSEDEIVSGFKVYYSDDSEDLDKYSVDAGDNLEVTLSAFDLTPGVTYSFYVVAYDNYDESGPSNIVHFTLPGFHIWVD